MYEKKQTNKLLKQIFSLTKYLNAVKVKNIEIQDSPSK